MDARLIMGKPVSFRVTQKAYGPLVSRKCKMPSCRHLSISSFQNRKSRRRPCKDDLHVPIINLAKVCFVEYSMKTALISVLFFLDAALCVVIGKFLHPLNLTMQLNIYF